MQPHKPKIAIATGDPAGIGPEISLKAALDPAVRAACDPILVSDPAVIVRHAKACGIATDLQIVSRISDAAPSPGTLTLLDCKQPDAAELPLGATSPVSGRASIAFAAAAVKAALAGEVDAVLGAPQNETSIAKAGIPFDGHPSFVARQTGTDPDGVFMMLCFGDVKVAHATLHQSVRNAIASITLDRVASVIAATDRTLKQMGVAKPRIAVSGLNPHAGEGGLFGSEEIEIIGPAITVAAAQGIDVSGPFGADTMFHTKGIDAFVVMLHDQGHVPAKFMAPNATIALTIGTPILFSSVAHGSAHDIAGKGIASPKAMIEAILHLAGARSPVNVPAMSA
jgi:4-hydroxythreonine-4-phosphate dehydrogenase